MTYFNDGDEAHYETTRPKKRRIRRRPEQELQKCVARYLDLALPEDAVWWHIPNGGARSKAEAGIFKAMGVKAGVPDIQVICRDAHKLPITIFIELKATKSASLSISQKAMKLRLEGVGCPYFVVSDVLQLEAYLSRYIRLKASTGKTQRSDVRVMVTQAGGQA